MLECPVCGKKLASYKGLLNHVGALSLYDEEHFALLYLMAQKPAQAKGARRRYKDRAEAVEEMERVAEGEIGEEELESGKNMCISSHRLNLQTLSDRSAAAALSESYGIGYDQFLKFEERISEIGVEDVRRVAGEILDGSRRAIAILKPRSR